MRNGKKDELRMAALRETMLAEGFRLFSERGIEAVGMQEVAKACHLGIATLYRYFGTKLDLVLAIGERKWAEYGDYARALHRVRNAEAMTAAEELDFYLDFYLDLYEHHKDLLRFNQNFNNYVDFGILQDVIRIVSKQFIRRRNISLLGEISDQDFRYFNGHAGGIGNGVSIGCQHTIGTAANCAEP